MVEGLFIVLEGIDGAGTTTHTRLLASSLRSQGLPIRTTREPSDGPIGTMIRQAITGRLVVPGINGVRPPAWNTMALLFAADRLDHVDAEITPNLVDGVTMISDRYDYSSVGYQSITSGLGSAAVEWVREINRFARRPDLTLVLNVTAETAAKRRASRGGRPDLFEVDDLQRKLVDFYAKLETVFPNDPIVHIDANRTVDVIANEIEAHVSALRASARSRA